MCRGFKSLLRYHSTPRQVSAAAPSPLRIERAGETDLHCRPFACVYARTTMRLVNSGVYYALAGVDAGKAVASGLEATASVAQARV